jgi:hypothetical protein
MNLVAIFCSLKNKHLKQNILKTLIIMKKIYITILAFITIVNAFAQNENTLQSKNHLKANLMSYSKKLSSARLSADCQTLKKDSLMYFFGDNPSYKYVYYYDNMGNEMAEVYYNEFINDNWVKEDSSHNTFNSSGLLIESIEFTYKPETNTFAAEYKTVYTYNTAGKKIKEESYYWDVNYWLLEFKIEWKYNSKNVEVITSMQVLNENSNQIENLYVLEEEYSTSLQDSLVYGYYVNNSLSSFEIVNYVYDSVGNLISEKDLELKGGKLSLTGEESRVYNNANQLTSSSFTSYNEFVGDETTTRIYAYNECGFLEAETVNYSGGGEYVINHYYSEKAIQTSLFDTKELNQIIFYPNPVKTQLHLQKNEAYKISNLQGQELASGEGALVDVGNLGAGVYLININGVSQKFIKE